MRWNRSAGSPASQTAILWCGGFITNRTQLGRRCAIPQVAGDSALLLALYRQEGLDAARQIEGPFAWVIWDSNRQQLVAARDRVGLCHLYYLTAGDAVTIANQVEQLLEWLPTPPQLNPRSLVAHLNGLPLLPGETHYEAIQALDPGSLLVIDRERVQTTRYWRLQPQPTLKLPSDAAYAEAHRAILAEVISGYIDFRPMGITLSSGLDSTTIAATIKSIQPSAELTAFSWITPELPDADESVHVMAAWQILNLPGVAIRADQHWPLHTAEGIHTYRSSPFYNYYTELWDATFQTMRRQGIDVAFTGMSSDSQFGGHEYAYLELLLTGRWRELIRQIQTTRTFSRYNQRQLLWRMLLRPAFWATFPRRRKAGKVPVPWLTSSYQEIYDQFFTLPMFTVKRRPAYREISQELGNLWLPQVVEQSNRQAAGYNLELRHPLVDYHLLEYALSLPLPQTIRAGQSKVIVRHAMQGRLPDSILHLRGKILPTAIVNRGLREREQAKVLALMTNMRAAEMGLLDEKKLQAAYHTYVHSNQSSAKFWHAITLEDWLRRYF